MRYQGRTFFLCFLFLTGSFAAADDLLDTSNNYTENMNDGALANRARAGQGYQHAMHHEHEARMHGMGGSPNPAILATAIAEARQAFSADNQAQELARAALQGKQSANTQSDQMAAQSANPVDLQALQDIANNQSEYAAAAQQIFSAYGVSLGTDQTTLTTPTGVTNLTVNNGPAGNTKTINSIDGSRTPSSVAASGTGPSSAAASGALAGTAGLNDPNARNLKGAAPVSGLATDPKTMSLATAGAPGLPGSKDNRAEELKKNLERNRALVLQQMGLKDNPEEVYKESSPIHAKQEDIFQAVHSHYQSLRDQSTFFEATLPADATPQKPDELPKFSRGL